MKIIKSLLAKIFIKILYFVSYQITKLKSQINPNLVDYACVGVNTNVQHLNLQVRNPQKHKIYLEAGENSVISGNFIFETITGKISIGNRSFIGGGTFICINEIQIGDDVMFAWGCTVTDNNSHSHIWSERQNDIKDWKKGIDEEKLGFYKEWQNVTHKKITIKNKAWIGFNSIILKGVSIGEGAIVGAGSVVTKDVPDWTIVAGNPAKIVKEIPENER